MKTSQGAQRTKGTFRGISRTHKPDRAYVSWRESLVPIAEAAADARWGAPPAGIDAHAAWARRWDACFHRAMERIMRDPFVQAQIAHLMLAVRQ